MESDTGYLFYFLSLAITLKNPVFMIISPEEAVYYKKNIYKVHLHSYGQLTK